MDEITQEQKDQLKSWAGQRDAILKEISVLQIEQEKLVKTNNELAQANTEIQKQVNQAIGRLDEITKKEDEFTKLTKSENAELAVQKTVLESKIEDLQKFISLLEPQKDSLEKTIHTLTDVHEKVFNRASDLDKTVGETHKVNSQNIKEIENLLISIKGEFQKIIDVNALNVEKANAMINELPRMIFDLQRELMERKHINKIKRT